MEVSMKNIDRAALASLVETFGRDPVAHDNKRALFDGTDKPIVGTKLSRLAKRHKQPVTVEIHGQGTVKRMRDGTRYKVGPRGNWVKLDT